MQQRLNVGAGDVHGLNDKSLVFIRMRHVDMGYSHIGVILLWGIKCI